MNIARIADMPCRVCDERPIAQVPDYPFPDTNSPITNSPIGQTPRQTQVPEYATNPKSPTGPSPRLAQHPDRPKSPNMQLISVSLYRLKRVTPIVLALSVDGNRVG